MDKYEHLYKEIIDINSSNVVVGVFCCLLSWQGVLCPPHSAHSYAAYVNASPVQTLLFVFILTPDTGPHINPVFGKRWLYTGSSCAPEALSSQCTGVSAHSNLWPEARMFLHLLLQGALLLSSDLLYGHPQLPLLLTISRLCPALFSAQMYHMRQHLAAWVWAHYYLCQASVTSL